MLSVTTTPLLRLRSMHLIHCIECYLAPLDNEKMRAGLEGESCARLPYGIRVPRWPLIVGTYWNSAQIRSFRTSQRYSSIVPIAQTACVWITPIGGITLSMTCGTL